MSHDFGHPSPFRFLEEGERLVFVNEAGLLETFVVPRTLRLDDVGRRAAQKHMRESLDFTKPATSQRPRPMRWESRS